MLRRHSAECLADLWRVRKSCGLVKKTRPHTLYRGWTNWPCSSGVLNAGAGGCLGRQECRLGAGSMRSECGDQVVKSSSVSCMDGTDGSGKYGIATGWSGVLGETGGTRVYVCTVSWLTLQIFPAIGRRRQTHAMCLFIRLYKKSVLVFNRRQDVTWKSHHGRGGHFRFDGQVVTLIVMVSRGFRLVITVSHLL